VLDHNELRFAHFFAGMYYSSIQKMEGIGQANASVGNLR
jgi:hypothetical protein